MKALVSIITAILLLQMTVGGYIGYRHYENLHRCADPDVNELVLRVFNKYLTSEFKKLELKEAAQERARQTMAPQLVDVFVDSADLWTKQVQCSGTLMAKLPDAALQKLDLAKLRSYVASTTSISDVEVADDGSLKVDVQYTAHVTLDSRNLYATLSRSARELATLMAQISERGFLDVDGG